jgi:hypothetical protein
MRGGMRRGGAQRRDRVVWERGLPAPIRKSSSMTHRPWDWSTSHLCASHPLTQELHPHDHHSNHPTLIHHGHRTVRASTHPSQMMEATTRTSVCCAHHSVTKERVILLRLLSSCYYYWGCGYCTQGPAYVCTVYLFLLTPLAYSPRTTCASTRSTRPFILWLLPRPKKSMLYTRTGDKGKPLVSASDLL